MVSMRAATLFFCLFFCLLPASPEAVANRRVCNAVSQCGACGGCGAGCGGGLCGLAEDCITAVSTHPSYSPPSKCNTRQLLASLKNGLSVENSCVRPELSLSGGGGTVQLQSDGCPDHAYFQEVRVADENSCKAGVGTICGTEWLPDDNPSSKQGTRRSDPGDITAVEPFKPLQEHISCPLVRSACEHEHGLPKNCRADGSSHTELYAEPAESCGGACGRDTGGRRGCGDEGPCGGCWSQSAPYGAGARGQKQEAEIGPYTPVKRSVKIEIPAQPTLGEPKELEKDLEGIVGVAINGVTIVGHHIHAESGEIGTMTMTFDNCGGHGDSDHRYHYHIPPMCLMHMLGATVPARGDWWLAAHPESQWPALAEPSANGDLSPLLGWSVDGHPIFGPYDPYSGELQVSQGSGCTSELDECNGKYLENGVYAYFLTPNYPYVPKCIRGVAGRITDDAVAGASMEQCPNRGYAPAQKVQTTECQTKPQSLFHEIEEEHKWVVASVVEGTLFLLVGLALAACVTPGQLKKCAYIQARWMGQEKSIHPDWFTAGVTVNFYRVVIKMYWSILLIVLFRVVFLMVDPYRMRAIIPRLVEGLLFGLVYPLINLLAVLALYLFGALRGWMYTAALSMVGVQLVIQATMDGLRAYGQQPEWHHLCQSFYAALGLVLYVAMLYVAVTRQRALWSAAASVSLAEVSVTIAALSRSMGDDQSAEYFAFQNAMRSLEILTCALFSAVLCDWARTNRERCEKGSVDLKGFESGLNAPAAEDSAPVRVAVAPEDGEEARRVASASSGTCGAGAVVGSMVHAPGSGPGENHVPAELSRELPC